MDPNSNPEETIVPIQLAQEILEGEALREMLRKTTERLETRISMTHTRIHRFPHRLRGIGGADERYIVPSVVAIGPYHHGRAHLKEMEEVKRAAAYKLCRSLGHSVEEVYTKVLSVAGEARRCYDDDAPVVAGLSLSDAEFATMMFVDGCFLLWFIRLDQADALTIGLFFSSGPSICKDIYMLENQLPWLVLESLMEFSPVDTGSWIDQDLAYFFYREQAKVRPWIVMRFQRFLQIVLMKRRRVPEEQRETVERSIIHGDSNSKPTHLLGLLRSRMISGMPPRKRSSASAGEAPSFLSRSAVDLAQIGVKLTASTRAGWFVDMNVKRKPLCAELSLLPLLLDHVNACRLVNMAALEAAEALAASSTESDGYVVSSYLSTLGMLMDREEDVHELRRRGVLSSNFSNTDTLAFFKGLGKNLRLGNNYFNTLAEIEHYVRQRPVMIAVHKFVYKNYRYIVAVMSIVSVLVGIFKAIYSLKKP